MRINRFLALATGMGRRAADKLVLSGQVVVNGQPAVPGQNVSELDDIYFNNQELKYSVVVSPDTRLTVMLNKPVGYVVSRQGQGSKTVYDLLPPQYHHLKPVGRLDKDSSGLLLLTNDGQLAYQLTHPSTHKAKIYEITLNKSLPINHQQTISQSGVVLEDGLSRFLLRGPLSADRKKWQVTLHEGRNRQIRRTFKQLGYTVTKLHRTQFGKYSLDHLVSGSFKKCS